MIELTETNIKKQSRDLYTFCEGGARSFIKHCFPLQQFFFSFNDNGMKISSSSNVAFYYASTCALVS